MAKRIRKYKGYTCLIAAQHELGNTDVTVYPTLKALVAANPCIHTAYDGYAKVTVIVEREAPNGVEG